MIVEDVEVAVVGGGVVGCAVAHALARRGVGAVVLEAEPGLALAASGTNSGILHTGFDSTPGLLETRLILRAAQLRETLVDELGVPVRRCGALLRPDGAGERAAVARLAENASTNGVAARLLPDGSLLVPGESVTDPVAFVQALAGAACAAGASVRVNARVVALERGVVAREPGIGGSKRGVVRSKPGIVVGLHDGERLRARAVVNCAGLYADEVAALAGDTGFGIYPRKGEFIVFAPAEPLDRIVLPVPGALGKGVLVFPTIDGLAIAGPTARERDDKRDWSVEPDAVELIRQGAARVCPALADAEPLEAYAGLRPAGRDGANYLIEPSRALDGLIHVAAIRSTGLSASLAIGEYVTERLAALHTIELGPVRPLPPATAPVTAGPPPAPTGRWWQRAARHHEAQR